MRLNRLKYTSLASSRSRNSMRRPVLHNGVNDPGILKAVFLAGGPGSGKSYAVSQLFAIPKDATALMTSPTGLKLVNSDPFFEHNLRRMGIDPKVLGKLPPEDFAALTEGPNSPRGRAKTTREAFLRHWTDGRLGLILDGTGDDFEKIRNQSERLRSLGYDTMMVFVNTSLDVAKKRNRQRARSLPDSLVEEIWNAVQENLGAFQDYFGRDNIIIVDATVAGPPSEKLVAAAEAFLRRPVQNRIGKAWIASQKASVMRTNPTGFYIKQSMLDWQIMDANGKPVPGKRFPFKADAERELARLNGGAVAIETAPAPAPAPSRVTAVAAPTRPVQAATSGEPQLRPPYTHMYPEGSVFRDSPVILADGDGDPVDEMGRKTDRANAYGSFKWFLAPNRDRVRNRAVELNYSAYQDAVLGRPNVRFEKLSESVASEPDDRSKKRALNIYRVVTAGGQSTGDELWEEIYNAGSRGDEVSVLYLYDRKRGFYAMAHPDRLNKWFGLSTGPALHADFFNAARYGLFEAPSESEADLVWYFARNGRPAY